MMGKPDKNLLQDRLTEKEIHTFLWNEIYERKLRMNFVVKNVEHRISTCQDVNEQRDLLMEKEGLVKEQKKLEEEFVTITAILNAYDPITLKNI